MLSRRFLLCLLDLLYLLGFLSSPSPSFSQQPPSDAAEISRDLLYHPAKRIEFDAGSVVFRAAEFTYRFDPASSQWSIARERNVEPGSPDRRMKSYKDVRRNADYRFVGSSDDTQGVLEIQRVGPDGAVPVKRLILWTRAQLAVAWLPRLRRDFPELTVDRVEKDFEPAEPEVAAVADDGTHLWLAIRHYSGEGWLGLGTVVQFNPETGDATVHQPEELAISSVTRIAAAGGALWLGAHRINDAAVEATVGLVRFEPSSGSVRTYSRESSPLAGRVVTALAAAEGALWVATDAGICRLALPAEQWTCWRIVPTVKLAAPAAVSSRPGGPARGRLAAGSHEVRWANAGFLEVVTPDAVEGWMEADDLEEHAQRDFDQDAYTLANTSAGGAVVMRLLDEPEGDPLAAAQVFRIPLERIGAPDDEGWQKVRAHVGWISRSNLGVTPAILPVSP
jgi:hypothetical protein